MLLNRHRGLANLHNMVTLLLICVFFWVYGEFVITFVPDVIRLTRETILLPYFLSLILGLILGWSLVSATGSGLPRLSGAEAAGLAARQVAIVALVMFATQDRSISRLFLGTFLVFTWMILVLAHLWLPRRLAQLAFGATAQIPTLFIGHASDLPAIREWIAERTHLGLQSVGFASWDELPRGSAPPVAGWLGPVAELPEFLPRVKALQVVLWQLPKTPGLARRVVEVCQDEGCRVLLHSDVEEQLGHPVEATDFEGHHYFTLHEEPLEEPLNRAVKRMFDILVSLPVVVFVLPLLCIVVWLAQRLQSRGPLFHIRPRAGEQRAHFAMVKFRTMHVSNGGERAEAAQATSDDQRVYPFGRFLRRHSLDEFPQFWNVLIGEMSIVGPRPVMPLLDEEFERQARAYRTRHFVKPGITGLAQAGGFRGEIKTPEQLQERVRLDLHYIAHWTIWLDVTITLKTFWQIFFPPKSAY
jgi:exopolysaccharide biosynthesis polyprenyl glycosylphosphotransferase